MTTFSQWKLDKMCSLFVRTINYCLWLSYSRFGRVLHSCFSEEPLDIAVEKIFTDWTSFLSPNQLCQSAQVIHNTRINHKKMKRSKTEYNKTHRNWETEKLNRAATLVCDINTSNTIRHTHRHSNTKRQREKDRECYLTSQCRQWVHTSYRRPSWTSR